MKVLRLHRDGRAQATSRGKPLASDPLPFKPAVAAWLDNIRQMDRVCALIGEERVHTLRYEQLCADPNGEMAAILEFLELPPAAIDWAALDYARVPHHVLGNLMRNSESIVIEPSDTWRAQRTEAELHWFDTHAGREHRQLGYDD